MKKWFFEVEDDTQQDLYNEDYYIDEVMNIEHTVIRLLNNAVDSEAMTIESLQGICSLIDSLGFIYRHNEKVQYENLTKRLSIYHLFEDIRNKLLSIDIYSKELYQESLITYLSDKIMEIICDGDVNKKIKEYLEKIDDEESDGENNKELISV